MVNKIKIKYKIKENNERVKIFGESFVENNKKNCFLVHKCKKYKLGAYCH